MEAALGENFPDLDIELLDLVTITKATGTIIKKCQYKKSPAIAKVILNFIRLWQSKA